MGSIDPYIFPAPTTLIPNDQYLDAEVVDLSEFPFTKSGDVVGDMSHSQRQAHDDIVCRAFDALRETGFLVVKGHGLSSTAFQRQFDLGKLFLTEVSEEDKQRLHARIWEGDWSGYKPRGYYKRPDGTMDSHEYCDFYPYTITEERLPKAAQPYMQEIKAFTHYNHYYLLRRILIILSIGLGLQPDTLWKLHHHIDHEESDCLLDPASPTTSWPHSKDHLRYALYHPPSEKDRESKKHLWLPGHTDLGSVTFLYSQPIGGLQALTRAGEWKYVRHYPEHIIINLGDSLEFVTGGILRATPHRVYEPPDDQRHYGRLGLFYFVPFLREVVLQPLPELLAAHKAGVGMEVTDTFEEYRSLGGKPLTSDEWVVLRSKLVGTKRIRRNVRTADEVLEDIHFRYNPV